MPTNDQPLVAIALPVYNRVKYFRECLEHIQSQTYTNWVCYITDNACTDGSSEIAQEFAEKDSRFKVFRNPETLIAYKNWNVALGRLVDVPAKYIKFECSDDWMFPNCLEEMVALHEKYDNLGAVYAYRLAGNKVDCDGLDINDGEVIDGKQMLKKSLRINIIGGLGQAMYRKELMLQINPELHVINENNIHCDVEMNDNVMLRSDIGFIFKVLTFYRIHDEQILSFAKQAQTMYADGDRRMKMISEMFPEERPYYEAYRREYALFLDKCRRHRQQDILDWHQEHLQNPIKPEELKAAKKEQRQMIRHEIKTLMAKYIRMI